MNAKRASCLLATIVCILPLSCADTTAPTVPAAHTAVALAPDKAVLLTLDHYDPMYKVDANHRVTHLRLTGRDLPVAAMAEVGKLTELLGLDLYGATVTDEGLAQLKGLQKLRSMGLGATPITDQGLVHLEKLPQLQWIWLPKGTVTQDGIEKLKEARPDMHVY